jgi:hypothetical protein
MNIACVKCGQGGYSKCPFCRNVFPNAGPAVEHLEQIVRLETTDSGDGCAVVSFRAYAPERTHAQLLGLVAMLLRHCSPEEIEQVACDHEWEFTPDGESTIGCGCDSPERKAARAARRSA